MCLNYLHRKASSHHLKTPDPTYSSESISYRDCNVVYIPLLSRFSEVREEMIYPPYMKYHLPNTVFLNRYISPTNYRSLLEHHNKPLCKGDVKDRTDEDLQDKPIFPILKYTKIIFEF